jgi:Transposase, Mutator family
VRRTVPPSAEIEAQIDQLLAVGVGENPRESLSELARLGARLIIQRAVEDEFDAWLGRARYERRPAHQRGLRNYDSGLRNGFRARRVQTLEGELEVEIPQVREAAEPFVSKLFPCSTKVLRTEPLRAMVIGAFVRGLSMRDIESLCEQAGLGKLSKATASRICTELRERFAAFQRRDLYEVQVATLFLDAIFLAVRPDGPKEGVLVAWGFTQQGERSCSRWCWGCASHTRTGLAGARFELQQLRDTTMRTDSTCAQDARRCALLLCLQASVGSHAGGLMPCVKIPATLPATGAIERVSRAPRADTSAICTTAGPDNYAGAPEPKSGAPAVRSGSTICGGRSVRGCEERRPTISRAPPSSCGAARDDQTQRGQHHPDRGEEEVLPAALGREIHDTRDTQQGRERPDAPPIATLLSSCRASAGHEHGRKVDEDRDRAADALRRRQMRVGAAPRGIPEGGSSRQRRLKHHQGREPDRRGLRCSSHRSSLSLAPSQHRLKDARRHRGSAPPSSWRTTRQRPWRPAAAHEG